MISGKASTMHFKKDSNHNSMLYTSGGVTLSKKQKV